MKPDHERVTKLLTDTVTLLCKNGLSYSRELQIQGLLGITVDSNEVFLVSINDSFSCSSPSVPSTSSLTSPDAAVSDHSRKRSVDGIVDLTRLVETPVVHPGMQPSQTSTGISPRHHGAQTRPRSAGSVSQTRSRAVTPSSSSTLTQHSHAATRQMSFGSVMTAGPNGTATGRRNSAEHLMSPNNQHSNASALVGHPSVRLRQRPHSGYVDSIHNLMLACERQLVHPQRQHPRQLPPPTAPRWTATEELQSMHLRQVHHNTAAAAAAGVGRPSAEHFGITPHPHRQPMLPIMSGNTCVIRSEANPLHYGRTNTAVPDVCPPPMLSRQPVQDVPRLVYHDHSRYVGNMPQMHATEQGRQFINSAAVQPPAKRHAPNHMLRQAMQSFDPAFMESHLPHSHGYFVHGDCIPHAHSVAEPHVSSPSLSHTSATQASHVTSSPVIKPPSSPTQPWRRSRPRQVEHIDLSGDDETDDSGVHTPVSQIVIQPDNMFDPLAAIAEPERSDDVSTNTSDLHDSEFEIVPENIHEIVPLDDGVDNEDDGLAIGNAVAAEDVRQSSSATVSVSVATSELSDSGRGSLCNHQNSEQSADQLCVSGDLLFTFPCNPIDTDSQLTQLSADESRQMTELYFDTDDCA